MKLGIIGISGRMGMQILDIALSDKEISHIYGYCKNEMKNITKYENLSMEIDLISFFDKSDVIIDFSQPEVFDQYFKINKIAKKPIVIGTTGFTEEQINKINEMKRTIKVHFSANMSKGVNLMSKICSEIAKELPNSEIEILEYHHNQKKDAPSGTAIMLANDICKTKNLDPKNTILIDRNHKRNQNEIGIASIRMGDIVGEHIVSFCFDDQILEIKHKANNRSIFAKGAIDMAKKLYSI